MKLLKVSNLPYTSFFASSIASSAYRPLITILPTNAETLAWTVFLQGSLVLGIWNQNMNLKSENKGSSLPMLAAFAGGVCGSVLGAIAGYFLSSFLFTKVSMEPIIGSIRVVAACMAASYIGGTANFFETGQILLGSC